MDGYSCNGVYCWRWIFFAFLLVNKSNQLTRASTRLCTEYASQIANYNPKHIYQPPYPTGTWSSLSCESVPVGQYLIRQFTISSSNRWVGRFHHYLDGGCSQPSFTITVEGNYRASRTRLQDSESAYGSQFKFEKMSLRIHSSAVNETIRNLIRDKCPPLESISNAGHVYRLSKSAKNRLRCKQFFGLHDVSYTRVMMEGSTGEESKYDRLFFGELPASNARKFIREFRPKGFQLPLVRIERPQCEICRLLKKDHSSIPILTAPPRSGDIVGSWVTQTCNVKNDKHDYGMTVFETRMFEISGIGSRQREAPSDMEQEHGAFVVHHFYFADATCNRPYMTVKGGGVYRSLSFSSVVDGALNVNFDVKWMTLAVHDTLTLQRIKTSEYCGTEDWELGREQNITSTGGCQYLGLSIPHTIASLVKVEGLGSNRWIQISDEKYGLTKSDRPTYLSTRLQSCHHVTRHMTEPVDTVTTEPLMTLPPDGDLGVFDRNGEGDQYVVVTPEVNPRNVRKAPSEQVSGSASDGSKDSGSQALSVSLTVMLVTLLHVLSLLAAR